MKGDFIKEIAAAVNKDNWDSRLNMPDFIIAEMIHDFLANIFDAMECSQKWKEQKEPVE